MKRLREVALRHLLDPGHHVVPVLRERRELADRLGGERGELRLHLAEVADRTLRELEALGDDVFGRRRMAGLDEVPRAFGRLGLDHDDVDLTGFVEPAGDDEIERALLHLLEGRVHDP